jgi:hypothetical protein
MAEISNVTKRGDFAFEKDGLDVTFRFEISEETKELLRIEGGEVRENGEFKGSFSMDTHIEEPRKGINYFAVEFGRSAVIADAVESAIAELMVNPAIA